MTEPVKGFRDYGGKDALRRVEMKKLMAETFEAYGFEPAETPIVEQESFVTGDASQGDEAISDIFRLKDKGKRNLALRYEFTFQLKRLARNKKIPYKRYQIGEVFRDEPVSKNRLRQFTQCDADVVGSSVKDEAEILAMASEILEKLGIKPIILINSRKLMNEILKSEKIKDVEGVLREIDKYSKIPEKEVLENLKKYDAQRLIGLFKQGEKFFKKFKSYKDIIELKKYCDMYGIKTNFSPTVVRGLSYYNGSVFEIKLKGSNDSLVGGGSYPIGNVQCTGISFGVERLSVASKIKIEQEKTLIVSLNQDKEAIKLAQKLRSKEKVSVFYGKPSKALQYANSYGFTKAVFVGKQEVKRGEFKVKNLKTGGQSRLEF